MGLKYKNVIAISSVDSADVITPFSSRGPEVELCAPGINVLSVIRIWTGSSRSRRAGAFAFARRAFKTLSAEGPDLSVLFDEFDVVRCPELL